MKYSKKRDRFEASNVWFSQSEMTAKSYNWWVFVQEVQGVVYFNNYGYSNSTRKHQSKVRWVLDSLGIKYEVIRTKESLVYANTKAKINKLVKEQAKRDLENLERKRVARNEKARVRREKIKAELLAKPLATIIQMRA